MMRTTLTVLSLCLTLTAWVGLADAQTVTRGPYLQTGTDTSVVVRWRTDSATASAVHFGPAANQLDFVVEDSTVTTEHTVTVTGLSPDTTYFYGVGTPLAVLESGVSYYFTTAPVPGTTKPTRIWVIGDSGTANSNAAAVYNAYLNYTSGDDTELWLMLGDNAYNDGTDAEYQNAVFDMYPELLRQVVLWSTLGNHDGHTADSATQSGPYYDIFELPTAAEAGGIASGTEAYYSFNYANIHFVVLDSYESSRSTTGPMLTWLQQDLAATTADWIIAFWHHPPYTKGSHNSDTEGRLIDMRENALPILEAHGVDLVLSGHSHSYERSYFINGHYGSSSTFGTSMQVDGGDGQVGGDGAYSKTTNDGAVYAVAGSSGKTSGGNLNHPAMFASINSLGSMVLDVNGNRMDAVFLDHNGTVLDQFTIENGPDETPPSILNVEGVDASTVEVLFAERVDQTTAETAGNYVIDQNIGVASATLSADERTVILATDLLTEGIEYTLTVNNVEDLIGNPIAANSQETFTYVNITTASFQDGVAPDATYQGTKDTYIHGDDVDDPNVSGFDVFVDVNYGGDLDLRVDGSDPSPHDIASLIEWDISSIPADAIVQSASIELRVFNISSGTYELYRLKRAWAEMEATWNAAMNNVGWSTAGAQALADRDPIAIGSFSPGSTGTNTIHLNVDGVAMVQGWIDGSIANHGIIIHDGGVGDGADFDSRDVTTPTNRPKLTVNYSMPPSGTDTEPPTAPTSLVEDNVTHDLVAMSWQASTDNVGVAGYKVYRDGIEIGMTGDTNYTDTTVAPNMPYTYDVEAYDAELNHSDPSNAMPVQTDPAPVAGMHVNDVVVQTRQNGKKFMSATAQIIIHDDGAVPVSGATVHGMWSGLVGGSASGTTGTDGTVSFGSSKVSNNDTGQFIFTVTDVVHASLTYQPEDNIETSDCMDTDGNGCSVGPPPPPAPNDLAATVTGDNIELDWSDITDADEYEIYRSSGSPDNFVPIFTTGFSDYVDLGPDKGVTHYYQVKAFVGGVESDFSNTASATIPDGSTTIMQVTQVDVSVVQVRKHWRGEADVTVTEKDNAANLLPNATVNGYWELISGTTTSNIGTASGVTNPNGVATIESGKQRAAAEDIFRFVVENVVRNQSVYEIPSPLPSGMAAVPPQ